MTDGGNLSAENYWDACLAHYFKIIPKLIIYLLVKQFVLCNKMFDYVNKTKKVSVLNE